MKSHIKIWQDFLERVSKLQTGDLTKKIFFEFLCSWLLNNTKAFGSDVWLSYKFESLVSCKPADYAIEYSEGSVGEAISRLKRLEPSSTGSIAMTLRDVLWDMLAYKCDVECSNCGDDDFRVLLGKGSKIVVLSCDNCGWAQFESGKRWSEDSSLIPANNSELGLAGYLVKQA